MTSPTRPTCNVHELGVVPFQNAWALQKDLVAQIAVGERPATLLLLQHPQTYTFGRRGNSNNYFGTTIGFTRKELKSIG